MTTEKKGKLEGAKKLKEMGMSNGDIKNATGLLDEEIESLQIKKAFAVEAKTYEQG